MIVNNGDTIKEEEVTEMDNYTDDFDEFGDFEWDEILGLTGLALNYTAHAEGMEGECFLYSVYFTDGTANEEQADAVRNAIQAFDFKLTDDDYIGYLDISATDNKIQIYLDLGNVAPQNENKIIHGILLALNSVQGIEKVIVNEDMDF